MTTTQELQPPVARKWREAITTALNEVRSELNLPPFQYSAEEPSAGFALWTEIDCTTTFDSRLHIYEGWDPDNGQGPRHPSQIQLIQKDGNKPFLRFNSSPIDESLAVWNQNDKAMSTFPTGSYVSSGASVDEQYGSILYGAVEVDCRATQATDGTRIAILLWPDGPPSWPDREIDFAEVSGDGDDCDRQAIGLNSHYQDSSGQHQQHSLRYDVDWLKWRTVRVEWTPGLIRWVIDGEEVGRMTDDVPDAKMYPCIQTALQGANNKGEARAGTTPGGVDIRGWRIYTWISPSLA